MKKLFAVYVGGEMPHSRIELHDMHFAVGEEIEDTYDALRAQWWGVPESLHIDCWTALTRADGYGIFLKATPQEGTNKLYFVNLGGYDPEQFTELHQNSFVVAETESKAKVKALKTVRHWQAFHRDYQYEVEKTFCLEGIVGEQGLYLHLEPTENREPVPFTCFYKPVGVRKSA